MQRHSEQNDARSYKRISRLIGEGKHQQDRCRQDEQSRQHGVAPDAVRANSVRLAATEDEDRAGGQCIEEPLGEDGQREERLKSSDGKQQQRTQNGLQNQRRRRRVKPRIDVCKLLEKQAIASGGERYPRS